MTVHGFSIGGGFSLVLVSVFLFTVGAAAGDESATPTDPVWRPHDFVAQERIGAMDLSPNGRRLAWVLRRPDAKKHRLVGDLRLTTLERKPVTFDLTVTHDSDDDPRFSPDGKWIAFLSDRDLPDAEDPKPEKPQVWVLPSAGGEPRPVTHFQRGIKGFDWLDAGTLVVAAAPDPDLRARRLKKAKDDTEEIEDEQHWVPVRLFTVPVKGGEAEPLTANTDVIDAFAVDREHRRVMARHLPSPHWEADHRGTPRLRLTDVTTGKTRDLHTERAVLPEHLAFTGNGALALATYTETTRPDQLAAGRSRLAFWRDGMQGFEPVAPLTDEEILRLAPTRSDAFAVVAEGVGMRLVRVTAEAASVRLENVPGVPAEHVSAAAASLDGATVAAVRSRADLPAELWSLSMDGSRVSSERRLSHLNAGLAGKPLGKLEVVHWKGALGETVEGLLYHPTKTYGPGPAPLVVIIHGGPAWASHDVWNDDWAYAANAYCQRGAYVLMPNYHGSTGYGLPFTESIAGRYYRLEVPDILAGIDELAARKLVDPRRVGLVGWSNGSILAIALSLERHFAAVSAGAGDVNWTSDFGNCAFGPNFDRFYIGGAPWTDPKVYLESSPLFKMEKVTSPTLIFFGGKDTSVPTEQGFEHYRALQQIGKAPVRFLLFPGEPHSLKNLVHQERKLSEELSWFDHFLFARSDAGKPELPAAAPMNVAAAAFKLSRAGGRLGVLGPGDVLLPQTAAIAALPQLAIAVVEVTRAQWAAFSGEAVEPGEANLPATVSSGERAIAYCRWLSERTGRAYRLPSAEERERMAASAVKKIGRPATLDAWGGAKLTHDDAAALRRALPGFGAGELGRAVATSDAELFPPPGAGPWDPPVAVFDLAGNLAEWVKDGDRTRPAGGSAWRAEVEAKNAPVDGEPIGLRIVRETPKGDVP